MSNIKELEERVKITSEIIEEEAYQNQYIEHDTKIILDNQIVIMKALMELSKGLEKREHIPLSPL